MGDKTTLFGLSSDEAGALFKKTRTVIMPFGSIEHHGPHLPLGTDAINAYVVAKRIAEKIPVVVAPLLPVGVSYYFMQWPGTISVETETYASFVEQMTLSLVRHGAKNIVFLNGHGGNRQGLELAAIKVRRQTGVKVLLVLTPQVALNVYKGELDMGHGGRIETNMVLAYNPELVQLWKATRSSGEDWRVPVDRMARIRGRARSDIYGIVRDFKDEISEDGWFGEPHKASVEEARQMVDRVADEIIEHMKRMFEGHDYGQ